MDIFQLQEMLNAQNPGNKFVLEFDPCCHRTIEIVLTEGNPNLIHHVEHNKVKVTIEGMDPYYFPIQAHRVNYSWDAIKKILADKSDVFINDLDLDVLRSSEKTSDEYKVVLEQLMNFSGLSQDEIEKKL